MAPPDETVELESQAREQTLLFADLAGFTALTEAHGDEQAVDLAAGPLAGCGSSSHTNTAKTGVGQSLRVENCANWELATVAQRRTTVQQLRKFAGGPVGSSSARQYGPVLSDNRAYKLFESYCAKPFARGFKLYKLYTRAAAFAGY
jgi:hypothetical protein